jgi:hypothetical protein
MRSLSGVFPVEQSGNNDGELARIIAAQAQPNRVALTHAESAARWREPTRWSYAIHRYGEESSRLLDLLDITFELPGADGVAEEIVRHGLKTPEARIVGFAKLAEHWLDPRYVGVGLAIAESLPAGPAQLTAFSQLLDVGGQLDFTRSRAALEAISDTDRHKRYLELQLATAAMTEHHLKIDLIEHAEGRAFDHHQLMRGVDWMAVGGDSFQSPFTTFTVAEAIDRAYKAVGPAPSEITPPHSIRAAMPAAGFAAAA